MISFLLILRTLSSAAASVRSYRAAFGSGRTGLALPSFDEHSTGACVKRRFSKDQALAAASASTTTAGVKEP
jgi:hypothetical protein